MSSFFVTVKIFNGDNLLHTHSEVPLNKLADIVMNWNKWATKVVVIDSDGNQYQEMSLTSG